ncbi:uncharacterized protein BJ212DRAFT_1274557, partial [Suillus subaureus]
KFKEAVQGVKDSQYAFDWLSETTDNETLVKWEAEATAAQDDQLQNPSAMDIYEVKLTKGQSQCNTYLQHADMFETTLTKKQQELHLLNCQARWPAGNIYRSAVTWLAAGITLEETQVALLIDVKKLGRWPTNTQKLAVAQHCN